MTTSTHIHTAPTTPIPPDPTWDTWSKAWTTQVKTLTGRTDLIVTVAPGAGRGAPACYLPALAAIEIDATLIGHPTITNPRRAGHKTHVPAAYGALVHEAAHAVHSLWTTPAGTPPIIADVAAMLEESRAEHRHRQRRSRDRKWLRHCVRTIVAPKDAPTDSPWHAAWAAGLLLARVDARILTHADTRTLRRAVTDILGRTLLRTLRTIWRHAHTAADDDTHTMLTLARQWCYALGINPDIYPHLPVPPPGVGGGRVAAAIGDVHTSIEPTTTDDTNPPDTNPPGSGSGHSEGPALPASWTLRAPHPDEQRAATQLAASLRRAQTREPVTTITPSRTPPGRLRVRHAITAAAQKATGAAPTATPWQRTTRRPATQPDLTIAVLVDVSGSMHAFAAPMSSTAWILTHAAHRIHATTATIAFGQHVTVVVPPGRPPTQVAEMRADSMTEHFDEAVDIADNLLHLTTPGTVRLATVVSDGYFENPHQAQHTITHLRDSGCAILWLTPTGGHRYAGPTTITVDNPTTCTDHITRAAVTALTHA